MAKNPSVQTYVIQEDSEVDECKENIAQGGTAAAGKLKDQVGDVVGLCRETKPIPDAYTFSTTAPKNSSGEVKEKSLLSGLQSALTPIVKSLNIGDKCLSPEPLKHKGNPHTSSPLIALNLIQDLSATSSSQPPNSDYSCRHFGQGDKDSHGTCLDCEGLPEITVLDFTWDSTMHLSSKLNTISPKPCHQNKTPLRLQNSTLDAKIPSKQSGTVTQRSLIEAYQKSVKENQSEICFPKLPKHNANMVDTPTRASAPERWLDDRYFPDITLLDVTRYSELSMVGEMSSIGITKDVSPRDSLKDNIAYLELTTVQPGRSDRSQIEFSSSLPGNATHTLTSYCEKSEMCVGENVVKASLTQDVSMEKSRTSSDPSEQNMVKSQTSLENTRGTHPANVTHDTNSSRDMSDGSQFSTFDMQCKISLMMVTSELHSEDVETSNIMDAKNEVPNSDDSQMTNKGLQPSPKTAGSANSAFTIVQPSNLSTSTNLSTTTQIPSPQNKTLDLSAGNISGPKADIDTRDQASSVSEKVTGISLLRNHNASADEASGLCDVQNATFDRHSFQKSCGISSLGEACAASFCLQNNTFETKSSPKQNGTITLSETSLSDSHNTLDKPSPSTVCNSATSPKDNNFGVLPSDVRKHDSVAATTDCNVKMIETPEITFEVNPAIEVASEAKQHETKDHSQSSLLVTDGISDTVGHQSMDTENNKANSFNLDNSLDLNPKYPLVSSTPMTNCKIFSRSTEREEGKVSGAQKKLYIHGPGKPSEVSSKVPLNIVCDRKTFLTQPMIKSRLPPLKAASQLLKYKPASILQVKCEPLTGISMTRQRTQAEVMRSTATPDAAQGTMGVSSSYHLRATTTGSKQPNSGLLRPPLSNVSSGIQKAAPALRQPTARTTTPVMKNCEAKKHHLTRGECLTTAKRTKMEAPLPSGCTEAKTLKQPTTSWRPLTAKTKRDDAAVPGSTAETSTSFAAAKGARTLKLPATSHKALLAKPQGHGCAKCIKLEEQLKIKMEEVKHLKEELLKYKKEEEC